MDKNNTFNSCAHLVEDEAKIEEFLEENKELTTMQLVLKKQLELQVFLEEFKGDKWYLPSFSKKDKSNDDVFDLILFSKLHFDREYFEFEDSLGGMSRGLKDASSVTKPWKDLHYELIEQSINDLSQDDLYEVKMEMIDMLHFLAMIGLAVGVNADNIEDSLTVSMLLTMEESGVEVDEDMDNIDKIMKCLKEDDDEEDNIGYILESSQILKMLFDKYFTLLVDAPQEHDSFYFQGLLRVWLMMANLIGLTSDEIKYLYVRKNIENFDRQERGY